MSLYAGFDLGGTHLKYGLVNDQGKIIFRERTPSPPSIKDLFLLLENLWKKLKQKTEKNIKAVGFGFPGIFSHKEQKIFQSPNYASLDNFNLLPALSHFIKVPFWINNDANLAAFGEYKAGKGIGVQSMVLLTIGTGVGSGVILEGKLWQGKCGFGGELGHLTVNHKGVRCNCGGKGCLETEVSAPKIVKNYLYYKKDKTDVSAEEVYQRALKGDEDARKAFSLAGYYLGIGLAAVINFLNPEKILLGGAVLNAGDYLLSPTLKETQKRCYKASFECCSIERASLGNEAGIIGAALWAKEQLKCER